MARDITEVRTQMGEHDRVLKSQITMMHQVKKDLIEIQDRQCHSNLRIRGYPEKSKENEVKLIQEVLDWATLILPDVPFIRYDIDVIHGVGPKRLGRKLLRDIVIRFWSYAKKEQLMRKLQNMALIVFGGSSDTNLSSETLQWRRQMHQVCQLLKKNNINYSWGYPVFFLRFPYGGRSYRVETKEEAMEKFKGARNHQ
ncbi:LINE-1 type transposase domain-containing protein 1, partial [Ophiophagus hannah]